MRLTTKGRFAVTAMIDLALRQDQGPVTLAGISQRQSIRELGIVGSEQAPRIPQPDQSSLIRHLNTKTGGR